MMNSGYKEIKNLEIRFLHHTKNVTIYPHDNKIPKTPQHDPSGNQRKKNSKTNEQTNEQTKEKKERERERKEKKRKEYQEC